MNEEINMKTQVSGNDCSREEAVFSRAREIPNARQRKIFLDANCGDDPSVRDRVEALLSSESAADALFERATRGALSCLREVNEAGAGLDAGSFIGSRIGPYRVIELLGEGGCGLVFRAEQEQPIQREVAIKIIRMGMDTASFIARFEMERRTLALMEHPHIARVLDAGATENGRPYLVMELVRGTPIHEFCDTMQLDLRERIELFINVCLAIQYAHQKGVIHRDLKPSNILVETHGGASLPKVIDFGIAKAGEVRPATGVTTASSPFVGTPAYMSPEQADAGGAAVDTRSDIYSLGAVLYELLTGAPLFGPERFAEGGYRRIREILLEAEPIWPSRRVAEMGAEKMAETARLRQCDAAKLIGRLRRDLDWVVMKAIEKEPRQRYETVGDLSADLRRFLNEEPVEARPRGRIYRLRKLVRRNRFWFASAAAILISLGLGMTASLWLLMREREANRLLSLAEKHQSLLLAEAEKGRREELRLRRMAEARESISNAVERLREGNLAAADALVADLDVISPDAGAAYLFRELGEWHVSKGQWPEARDRFAYLVKINRLAPGDMPSMDYLRAAAAWVESDDTAGYDQFRREALERYRKVEAFMPLERILKVATLTPPSGEIQKHVGGLQDRLWNSVESELPLEGETLHARNPMLLWRMVSVALGEYRRGNHDRTKVLAEAALAGQPKCAARDATSRVLLAMVLHHDGFRREATNHLKVAAEQVETRFSGGPRLRDDADGHWFDWVIARILLREARDLIGRQ